MERNTLAIAEHFYSIQGEGVTSGYPAYFIRLRGCNLMCGGPNGSLMKEGKATWWCDTEAIWRTGVEQPFSLLKDSWLDLGIIDWVVKGRVHLIWTGGEPTLPKHQASIVSFLQWFSNDSAVIDICNMLGMCGTSLFNEIETNGTGVIEDDLFERLHQINCSVKLANCGESKERRIRPLALERIISHPNHYFKFVISEEKDLDEIDRDFVYPFGIDPKRVILMPGLDCAANFNERTRFCLEMAKKYGFIGLTRLHVAAWDKTTGV